MFCDTLPQKKMFLSHKSKNLFLKREIIAKLHATLVHKIIALINKKIVNVLFFSIAVSCVITKKMLKTQLAHSRTILMIIGALFVCKNNSHVISFAINYHQGCFPPESCVFFHRQSTHTRRK